MKLLYEQKLVECATCGDPADISEFQKKILRKNFHFCSEGCMNICSYVVRIQFGVLVIGISVILSLFWGATAFLLVPIGVIPLLCGLRDAKNCIFVKTIQTNNVRVDPSEFGKV
ncbi:MAG: hypothetical protein ACW99A_14440 [Candidatus Kariarchaeaceae archaeon]